MCKLTFPGLDRSASSSFMNQIEFLSYNTKNIFRAGLFMEHIGESKVNFFLLSNKLVTLQHHCKGVATLNWLHNISKVHTRIVINGLCFCM